MPTYTFTQVKSRINSKIKGKIGVLVNSRETINDAVRQVLSDADLVSARRRTLLTPNLFTNIFEYASPSDLKGYGIINIEPQTDRARRQYSLVPSEEFYRRRDPNTIAVDDYDFIKKVLVNSDQPSNTQDLTLIIAALDTTTSGAATAWTAVGDATNIRADSDNFVRENGSLRFDIGTGATTTAGIQNTTLYSFDATNYFGGNSSLFVWVWITSTTNLTNFVMKIGSGTGNYYSKTITAASDGTAFSAGWNLLRFDLTNLTSIGTPVLTAFTFCSVYMTKTAGKISETDYRFDSLMIKKGEPNYLKYYSKFGWQTSGGTWKENSTLDSDYLNVNTNEYNLIIMKGSEMAADEVDELDVSKKQGNDYKESLKVYKTDNPSESLLMISTYADFKHT